MQGLLHASGILACQHQLGESLRRSFPFQRSIRTQDLHRAVNLVPYRSTYFGEKIHFDQNEKLAIYGVTHVLAVDGYSRRLVGFVVMPIKNPITIYSILFRPIVQHSGLWDQVRMDHGTEFVLVTTVQQHPAPLRNRQHRHPVLQTTSQNNHRAARIWVEVNRRVNYLLKAILMVALEVTLYPGVTCEGPYTPCDGLHVLSAGPYTCHLRVRTRHAMVRTCHVRVCTPYDVLREGPYMPCKGPYTPCEGPFTPYDGSVVQCEGQYMPYDASYVLSQGFTVAMRGSVHSMRWSTRHASSKRQ